MLLNMKVQIEEGEVVSGYSYPYVNKSTNELRIDSVVGIVEKIDDKLIKVEKYPELIPIHRIELFSFGGVEMPNPSFDWDRMCDENDDFYRDFSK